MQRSEVKTEERVVYNIDTERVEVLTFLIVYHITKYNAEMGNVDVADQLRGYYRCGIGVKTGNGGGQFSSGPLA